MTEKATKREILFWEEQLTYYLGNYHRAVDVGAFNSRDNNFADAARAAAILVALKGMQHHD